MTDRKGTVTGRLTTSEPTFQELPPRDPWGWGAAQRARVADAFRRGDYTSTPGEPLAGALGRLQRAGACVMALPQPGEAARPPGGPLDLDYRHLEERVMAHVLSEPGLVSPEAWAALGRCPWDYFKPGRDLG